MQSWEILFVLFCSEDRKSSSTLFSSELLYTIMVSVKHFEFCFLKQMLVFYIFLLLEEHQLEDSY